MLTRQIEPKEDINNNIINIFEDNLFEDTVNGSDTSFKNMSIQNIQKIPENEQAFVSPAKRGRGRPRKHPLSEKISSAKVNIDSDEIESHNQQSSNSKREESEEQKKSSLKKKEEVIQRKPQKGYLKKRSQESILEESYCSDIENQFGINNNQIEDDDDFNSKVVGKGNAEFLNDYKQRIIGRSSNSKIFELRDPITDLPIGEVVKEVPHKMSNHHQSECEELRNEYSFLQKINHPRIITLGSCKEFIRDRNFCGIMLPMAQNNLMEYAKTQRHGRVQLTQIRIAFKQIAEAVYYLHENYISHNDIKPDNIFMFGQDDYKLADFGFSIDLPKPCAFKTNSVLSQTLLKQYKIENLKKNWRMRCKQYVAPELIKLLNGKRPRTPSDERNCDVFALGVSFFIIIFYQLPFCGCAVKTDQRYKHIFNGSHDKFWSQFSSMFVKFDQQKDSFTDELKDLFNKILEPDPLKRSTIQEILEHPWLNH